MSKHAKLSPEAQKALANQNRKALITSLIGAIGAIGLIGVILASLAIFIPVEEPDVIISYSVPDTNSDSDPEPTVKPVTRSTATPSPSSSAADIISSVSIDTVSIPTPTEDTSFESADFGSNDDFGEGFDFSDDIADSEMTFFGSSSGSGLRGFLYDCKQNTKSKPNKLGSIYSAGGGFSHLTSAFQKELRSVIRNKFSETTLKDYFRHDSTLKLNYLVIGKEKASVGPAAFGAEGVISPSGWIVKYEGVLAQDHPKKVKFYGRFDDVLLVYVNGKLVLDGSWNDGYSSQYNSMDTRNDLPKVFGPPFKAGKFIKLRRGDSLTVIVGEVPGGGLTGGLFIEEEGVENPSLAAGGEFLPIPFCTSPLSEADLKSLDERKIKVCTTDIPHFPIKQ